MKRLPKLSGEVVRRHWAQDREGNSAENSAEISAEISAENSAENSAEKQWKNRTGNSHTFS